MEFHQFASHLAIKYQVTDFIFWIVLHKCNWYFFSFYLIIELTGWCWHFIQIAQVGHFWKLFIVQPLEVPLTYFFFLTVLWKYSCSFQKFLIYFQIGYHILERSDSAWNIYSKNYFILISALKNVFAQKISSLLPALFLL